MRAKVLLLAAVFCLALAAPAGAADLCYRARMAGQYQDAVKFCTQRIKSGQRQPWHDHANRGVAFFYLGQHQKAIADFETSVRQNPSYGTGYNNLAYALLTCPDKKRRDYRKGLAVSRKAAQLKTSPATMDTLALALALNGDFAKAAQTQKKAVELLQGELKGKPESARLKKFRERLRLYGAGRLPVSR